jgi:hypothetical protein
MFKAADLDRPNNASGPLLTTYTAPLAVVGSLRPYLYKNTECYVSIENTTYSVVDADAVWRR